MAPQKFTAEDRTRLLRLARSKGYDVRHTMSAEYLQELIQKGAVKTIENFIIKKNENKLKTFLKTPEHKKSILVNARILAKNIRSLTLNKDFYLIAHSIGNGDELQEEFKLVNNVEEMKPVIEAAINGLNLVKEEDFGGSDIAEVYNAVYHNTDIELIWKEYTQKTVKNSGAFFPYYNLSRFDLTKYQIFKKSDDSKDADKMNCLLYALKQTGLVSDEALNAISLKTFSKDIMFSDLKAIAKELNLTFHVQMDTAKKSKLGTKIINKGHLNVALGLIENHYFLNYHTKYTREDITGKRNHHQKKNYLTTFQLISLLFKQKLFEPITLENLVNKQCCDKIFDYEGLTEPKIPHCSCIKEAEEMIKETERSQHIKLSRPKTELEKLAFIDTHCKCKSKEFRHYGTLYNSEPFKLPPKSKSKGNIEHDIWFIDTETFKSEYKNYHIPYCLCAIKYSNDQYIHYRFYGLDCVEQFMAKCLTKHAIVYAHNLAFDFRMLIDKETTKDGKKVAFYDFETPIETGTKLKQVQCKISDGKFFNYVLFKDSYAFLANKLSALPSMFNLNCGDKEAYPYTLINETNFDQQVSLTECKNHLKKEQINDFIENAMKIGALKNNMIDIKKYTIHYCAQDTKILAHAFIAFRKQIQEVCKMDIISLISLPQLADLYLRSQGVYDDCYSFNGLAQDFIRRCCVGGRVMSANNQKYHIKVNEKEGYTVINDKRVEHHKEKYTKEELQLIKDCINCEAIADFDAVSLYPSAMHAMKGYLKGLPKVLSQANIDNFEEFKKTVDGYFVEVEVLSHKVDREFPLQSIKTEAGIREFTNDIDGKHFYVDNIALEDFVEFQGVKYKVIRGYYFNNGFNNKIHETIEFMFNERLRLKAEGNALQNVYKLLMNSAYGKLLMKPISTSKKFFDTSKKQLDPYVSRNIKFIKSYKKITDSLYIFNEQKSIVNHFCCPHIGGQVLSMSKRLMNRVMCLAEDKEMKIYYQDTDSMHIPENCIEPLSKAFKEKYNTNLIGKAMGQFHSDFEVNEKGAKNVRAVETIVLGKKCYIDKLAYEANGKTKYDYHVRMKGVPAQSVIDYGPNLIDTYTKLFNGESLTFDMSAYCPLQIDKDYRVRANTRCLSRTLKF